MVKVLAVYEALVEADDVRREDGGAALIVEVEGVDDGPHELFCRLQSWADRRGTDIHPSWMTEAVGKRLRVTVEVLDG